MSKVRCQNCGCVLHKWGRPDGSVYWKHCAGGGTKKACRKAQPDSPQVEMAFKMALGLGA